MLKRLLLFLLVFFSFDAYPQISLVKNLAKKVSSSNPMELIEVLKQIEPAFSILESANNVLTWYTAGKAAFNLYDEMYNAKILGMLDEDGL